MADTIRQLFVVVTVDKTPPEDVSVDSLANPADATSLSVAHDGGRSGFRGGDGELALEHSSHGLPDPPSERYELRMRNAQDTAGSIKSALMSDMKLVLDRAAGKDTSGTKAAPLQSYNEGLVLLQRYPDTVATKVLYWDIIEDNHWKFWSQPYLVTLSYI